MRQRLRSVRAHPMARRLGNDERFVLSPRARRIAGWVAAILLVLGIALVVGVLGGDGDGTPIGSTPSPSSVAGDRTAITFGTAIDPATGKVAEAAKVDRFAAGDTFAYSVALVGAVPEAVYVEVLRTGGAADEIVQQPIEAQILPDPDSIAFTVPTDDLLAVFGSGTYLMRIYAEPAGEPIAEGSFELVGADVSPSAGP